MLQDQTDATRGGDLDRFYALQRILRCPHTGEPLSLLSLSELQDRLPGGTSASLAEGTRGAFASERKQIAFPIIGGIVHFLDDDVLSLSATAPVAAARNDAEAAGSEPTEADSVKASVRQFYDDFGWQRNEFGIYNDTWINSQSHLTAHGAYELMSHLALVSNVASGEFLLDAASGAIAHPEYLSYSWLHQYRVCVDMSKTALQEAAVKIGDRGFCIQADICQLPFCDDAFEGIVSGYTIQHIPADHQRSAVGELYRTLAPGNHLCIMTNIAPTRWHGWMLQSVRAVRKLLKLLGTVRYEPLPDTPPSPRPAGAPHELYYHPQAIPWWRRLARELNSHYRLESLRLFKKKEFEYLFGASIESARSVRRWETFFPRMLAPMSVYLLVDLLKPQADGK